MKLFKQFIDFVASRPGNEAIVNYNKAGVASFERCAIGKFTNTLSDKFDNFLPKYDAPVSSWPLINQCAAGNVALVLHEEELEYNGIPYPSFNVQDDEALTYSKSPISVDLCNGNFETFADLMTQIKFHYPDLYKEALNS